MIAVVALLAGLGLIVNGEPTSDNESLALPSPSCTLRGWFGNKCQFMCHCAGNEDCDKFTGHCDSGCSPDWFGPACQYASIRYSVLLREPEDMEWLTDKDDSTCNTETSEVMKIRLYDRKPLTWIRLVVKTGESIKIPEGTKECKRAGWFGDKCQYRCHCTDDVDCDKVTGVCSLGCGPGWFGPSCQYALHRDLQITYLTFRAHDGTCAGGFVTNVDDGVLDISCVTDTPVVKLELSGPGVRSLCSLHISGGKRQGDVGEKKEVRDRETLVEKRR
ncbi:multiple epidermal growth factor-like domains protein 6 [Elysia marginata]|uniref:Multiple epidermal growth factor-like domains protein 6 n=1 Tax=Elysia marginata TaxID=1093978 RepID=A0AAV4FIX9_9GAST|nr:multiple epidermal growth factor-like domains protein 6 [Elysia marginata]